MERFYLEHFKNWLKLNDDENQALKDPEIEQESENDQSSQTVYDNQTDIIFENSDLKLIVEKGLHKRQKKFKLQDHLFYFRILQKQKSKRMPLLIEILDFLHAAFTHVLESIKTFYHPGKLRKKRFVL